MSSTSVEAVVRTYYRLVADLGSSEDELADVIHDDYEVVEHPNAVTPMGAVNTKDKALEGLRSGRALLAEQTFDVDEVLVSDDRAAVRARWVGVIGVDRGPLTSGTRLHAQIASFLTVRDGRIIRQETYDCYAPVGVARAAQI